MPDQRKNKKITVVGAGICGVSTALWLQRDGHDVVLVDREGPAAGTSYGNAGILASCGITPVTAPGLVSKAPKMLLSNNEPLYLKWGYLPKLMPWLVKYLKRCNEADYRATAEAMFHIIGDSLEEHQALAKGTAAEKYIHPSGYTYIYKDRAAFNKDALAWEIRKNHGFKWRIFEGEEVQKFEPEISPSQQFVLELEGHGRISDPGAYVKALAKEFESNGGELRIGSLQDFEYENGALKSVIVDGEAIASDCAVVTLGAWSKVAMKLLGLNIPLESERGYHVEYWNPNFMAKNPTMVTSAKFACTPMDGRFRAAGIVEFGGLEAGPSKAPIAFLERKMREVFPNLKFKKKTEWLGHRPAPTDSIPVIGEIAGKPGVYAGFGHQHVGLTGGPKTGRILAQLIDGKKLNFDLAQYSPMRFQ